MLLTCKLQADFYIYKDEFMHDQMIIMLHTGLILKLIFSCYLKLSAPKLFPTYDDLHLMMVGTSEALFAPTRPNPPLRMKGWGNKQ